ncbi:TnsD family Tn7-like transposition protein [Bacillus sp. B-jedd]|uniref:TnsD family Tn7-like transposition protein n=1 Tax=Bacillus sp. B-jedd TaxID=1476857 RepID=UPI0005155A63|nr:TnsD family Tn7-like transposition protein [Bacillus sp. B-jedd]CEG25319.1 Tn7-like transposition protein D [Bacillus sp. B-jedd]
MQVSMNLSEQKNDAKELAYFPEPYPDEDYRNLVIRYCHKTNTSLVECMNKLFNVNTNSPNYFPYNLGYLVRKLPYDEVEFIESFIGKNTFFPVYSLFIPLQLSEQIMSDFKEVPTNKDLAMLGLRHNIGKELKYCSRCIEEDLRKGREPYTHRIHQFTNLNICLFHKTKLIYKCPICNVYLYEENNKNPRISVLECKNGHSIKSEEYEKELFTNIKINVLEGLQFLFENYSKLKGFPLYDYYRVYLVQKGYMDLLGRLNNKIFYKDFLEFYSEDLFIQLGYSIKQLKNRLALRIFTMDKYSYDPILHILAIIFLAGSLEHFFNEPLPNIHCNIPFGNGPWPCLNITCKYYEDKVVKKCDRYITRRGNLYGNFLCLHCGFRYQLKFDINVPINESRLWINDYGDVWKDTLIELYNNGFSQIEIARELNVNRSTVKKYIQKIGTEKFREPNHNPMVDNISRKTPSSSRKLSDDEYKELKLIIKELCKDKSLTRINISDIVGPKKYRAMLRMEPEWMNEVLPEKVHKFVEKDWQSIDLILADVIERKAKELYKSNPTRRITKYLILGRLDPSDKKRIIHHPDKLMESMGIINKYVENIEAYQIRIIPHALTYMKKTSYNTDPERIYCFRLFDGCSEKVKQEIVKYINTCNEENDDIEI